MTTLPNSGGRGPLNWSRFLLWSPHLERECRGSALLYVILWETVDGTKPLVLKDLAAALACQRENVLRRLEALEERQLLRVQYDAVQRRFVQFPDVLPPAPGEPPPAPVPAGVPRVKKLRVASSAVPVPVSAAPRPLAAPSLRPAWTRWKLKSKSAAHWLYEDFVGYWVCNFKELYGFEDPDFQVSPKLLEGYRHMIRQYLARFFSGDKDDFRAYFDFVFEKVRAGELDRSRPLRFGSIVNFRRQGFLVAYRARGTTAGRRGADQDGALLDNWRE